MIQFIIYLLWMCVAGAILTTHLADPGHDWRIAEWVVAIVLVFTGTWLMWPQIVILYEAFSNRFNF